MGRPSSFAVSSPTPSDTAADAVVAMLEASGQCDARTMERARRVAVESGQRVDRVLIQLGLVNERDLAAAFAAKLGLALAGPERYPATPLLPDQLAPRFLRHARPCRWRWTSPGFVLAMADPLDRVHAGRQRPPRPATPVRVEVAVPLDMEAALDRLYPDTDAPAADARPVRRGWRRTPSG